MIFYLRHLKKHLPDRCRIQQCKHIIFIKEAIRGRQSKPLWSAQSLSRFRELMVYIYDTKVWYIFMTRTTLYNEMKFASCSLYSAILFPR